MTRRASSRSRGLEAESAARSRSRRSTSSSAVTRERDEYLDALQRLKAEFDNYRKRVAREQGDLVARASERLVKQLLPVLDDLERTLEAAASARGRAARGRRPARPSRARRRARSGRASSRSRPTAPFDPHTQEALLSQPSEAAEGTVIQVLQKGYRLGDRVLRPARVVVSAGTPAPPAPRPARRSRATRRGCPIAHGKLTLRDARRREERLAGRAEEGLPQARPSVPPGQEPGRRGGRDALQGDPARLRRPLRPGEAQAVRPRSARANGRTGPGPTNVDFGDFDLGDIFGGLFGRGRGGRRAAGRSAVSAAPTSRSRCASRSRTR